jgi:hypothetical protein
MYFKPDVVYINWHLRSGAHWTWPGLAFCLSIPRNLGNNEHGPFAYLEQ